MKYADDEFPEDELADESSASANDDEFVAECVSSLAGGGGKVVDASVSPDADEEDKFVAVTRSVPESLASSLVEGGD